MDESCRKALYYFYVEHLRCPDRSQWYGTDEAISMCYIPTKEQIADIFTKGTFTEATWKYLLNLLVLKNAGSTK